jgi:anti-sigma factor RsiW
MNEQHDGALPEHLIEDYALGRLSGEHVERIERQAAVDPRLAARVAEIREEAAVLRSALSVGLPLDPTTLELETLALFLDHGLSEQECRRVETCLAGHPENQKRLIEVYRETQAVLRGQAPEPQPEGEAPIPPESIPAQKPRVEGLPYARTGIKRRWHSLGTAGAVLLMALGGAGALFLPARYAVPSVALALACGGYAATELLARLRAVRPNQTRQGAQFGLGLSLGLFLAALLSPSYTLPLTLAAAVCCLVWLMERALRRGKDSTNIGDLWRKRLGKAPEGVMRQSYKDAESSEGARRSGGRP